MDQMVKVAALFVGTQTLQRWAHEAKTVAALRNQLGPPDPLPEPADVYEMVARYGTPAEHLAVRRHEARAYARWLNLFEHRHDPSYREPVRAEDIGAILLGLGLVLVVAWIMYLVCE